MNRKVLMYGVLGIAATAFIVDRVFLSEPAGAKAGTPAVSTSQARVKTTKKTPVDAVRNDSEHPALSHLSQLPDTVGHRNVFTPSPSMMSHLDQLPEAKSGRRGRSREKEQKEQGLKTFQDAHELQATAITPGTEMAIIDGKVLRIGETLDGFTLEGITPYTARFQQDDAVVELTLPTQP